MHENCAGVRVVEIGRRAEILGDELIRLIDWVGRAGLVDGIRDAIWSTGVCAIQNYNLLPFEIEIDLILQPFHARRCNKSIAFIPHSEIRQQERVKAFGEDIHSGDDFGEVMMTISIRIGPKSGGVWWMNPRKATGAAVEVCSSVEEVEACVVGDSWVSREHDGAAVPCYVWIRRVPRDLLEAHDDGELVVPCICELSAEPHISMFGYVAGEKNGVGRTGVPQLKNGR